MSSKLDYLKKYVSKGESLPGENGGKPKKKKKKKAKPPTTKRDGNLAIVDDDVDWRSLVPALKAGSSEEEDPEDKPIVAEVRDESVVKWQPFGKSAEDRSPHPSPPRHGQASTTSPRQTRHDSPDNTPPRRRQSPDSASPERQGKGLVRRRKRHDSPDNTPPRRRRHESPDSSPQRKKKIHKRNSKTSNSSPPHRKQRDTSDMSPPQKYRQGSPDMSPPRRKRQGSPDMSPPRRKRMDIPDISPLRRKRQGSPDMSPPRRKRMDTPDMSPPRRKRHDSLDLSPPRKSRPLSSSRSGGDLSPPRKQMRMRPGESVQQQKERRRSSREGEGQAKRGGGLSKLGARRPPPSPTRMSSGTRSGLQDAEELRRENATARAKEEEMYKSMDPSESGRGAETVYRDKLGRKINPKLERLKQKEVEMKKLEEEEKFMQWGRGVATLQMAEDKVKDELYEMSKPLARYVDDEDLERMLKAREREGDPMLKFIKKKPKLTPTGKPKKERPMYRGSFPPNRYGIRPGYRWDGVPRSNGFEMAWFSRESNKKATADDAYKWSVENM